MAKAFHFPFSERASVFLFLETKIYLIELDLSMTLIRNVVTQCFVYLHLCVVFGF